MKNLFKKEELEYLSANFILSIPGEDKAVKPESVDDLKDSDQYRSTFHQNKNKTVIGGYYKAITRLIE